MTYGINQRNDMPIFCALLLLCFFTCTNTEPDLMLETTDTVTYSVPINFDSALTCAEHRLDSTEREFNRKLEQVLRARNEVLAIDKRQPEQDTAVISRRQEQ